MKCYSQFLWGPRFLLRRFVFEPIQSGKDLQVLLFNSRKDFKKVVHSVFT